MDPAFLEAWGRFLIAAAKGGASLEAFSKWLNPGGASLWAPPAEWCRYFGIDLAGKQPAGVDEALRRTRELFEKNFSDALLIMGAVPKKEYDALVEKYDALKKENETQARTIEHLQWLLATGQTGSEKVWEGIQGLAKVQEDQFHQAMDLLARVFKKEAPSPSSD